MSDAFLIQNIKQETKPTVITDGLQLYLDAGNLLSYPGSGTTWTDLSGNNYNFTLFGSVNYSSNNSGILQFNGGIADRNMPSTFFSNPSLSINSTISFWANVKTSSSYYVLSSGGQTGSLGYAFSYQSGSPFVGVNRSNDRIIESPFSNNLFPLNTWIFWTFVTSSGRLYVYKNNNLSFSIPFELTTALSDNLTIFRIAGPNNVSGLTAIMDFPYLLVYNRALTLGEIRKNFEITRGRFGV